MSRSSAASTMQAVLGPRQWRSISVRRRATAAGTSNGRSSMPAMTRLRASSSAARVTCSARRAPRPCRRRGWRFPALPKPPRRPARFCSSRVTCSRMWPGQVPSFSRIRKPPRTPAATVLDQGRQPFGQAFVESGDRVRRVVFQLADVHPGFQDRTVGPNVRARKATTSRNSMSFFSCFNLLEMQVGTRGSPYAYDREFDWGCA